MEKNIGGNMGKWGVGMPASVKLDLFADQVWNAFGHCPYLVGSVLHTTEWRDVDVRLILPDDEYEKMFPDCDPRDEHRCSKWVALCIAFSCLGKEMTGLPIDFQIQQQTHANKEFADRTKDLRSAIGIVEHRIHKD
jgi:hypothetical protein